MKELFKKQLESSNIITEEILEKLKSKTYQNGDNIKVGDKVLYALLTDIAEGDIKPNPLLESPIPIDRDEPASQTISLVLIILNENHLDLYTYDDSFQNKVSEKALPIIRLK